MKLSDSDTANIRKELLYFKDPAKLALTVKRLLTRNDLHKAINLVRLASAQIQCIVSWNAIVDWLVLQQQYDSAFKVYNEMKKRSQFPDPYTASIFLRGLAQRPVSQKQVKLAIQLHDSFNAENSRIKPSIIFTNAAIAVCANAADSDALWTLVSKLPEKGLMSANHATFDTILTFFRREIENLKGSDPEHAKKIDKSIHDGRKIWQDVSKRWKNGTLTVDEGLLCNYLRLLLCDTSRKVAFEVLTEVENFTGITSRESDLSKKEDSQEGPMKGVFVRPGSALLSIILTAYQSVLRTPSKTVRSFQSYWRIITEDHSVYPHIENYDALLRLYRLGNLSGKALEVVKNLVKHNSTTRPTRTTFLLAMAACSREIRDTSSSIISTSASPSHDNSHSIPVPIRNATQLLNLHVSNSNILSAKLLQKYVETLIFSDSVSIIWSNLFDNIHPLTTRLQTQLSTLKHPRRPSSSYSSPFSSSSFPSSSEDSPFSSPSLLSELTTDPQFRDSLFKKQNPDATIVENRDVDPFLQSETKTLFSTINTILDKLLLWTDKSSTKSEKKNDNKRHKGRDEDELSKVDGEKMSVWKQELADWIRNERSR